MIWKYELYFILFLKSFFGVCNLPLQASLTCVVGLIFVLYYTVGITEGRKSPILRTSWTSRFNVPGYH